MLFCCCFVCLFVFYQKEVVLTRELATSDSRLNTGYGFCSWLVQKASDLCPTLSIRWGWTWCDISPSRLQIAKLRTLYSSAENEPPVPLVRNWRPPQPIKGRIVKASFK